ncbi:MAG: SDR family oxidoreductase [Pseudomonadota bacterium]
MSDLIFLTGASGVVGTELVPRLPQDQLLLGRHRARPGGTARQIAIDVTRPKLGLTDPEFRQLADEVTCIIHAAAITEMGGEADGLTETNIDGVRHMLELAEAAQVPFHYVSTAYCSEDYGPLRPVESPYVESKRTAERLVKESGQDWTIIKPSIVCGHSETGVTASFQGFHLFIGAIIKGKLPIIPLDPEALCDFVPCDLIARGIEAILATPEYGRTYWLTGGATSISIKDMLAFGQPFAKEIDLDLNRIPIVAPDSDELTRMMQALSALPPKLRDRFETMLELSKVMATERPFPSDYANLFDDNPITPDLLRRTLGANIRYWGQENGMAFQTPADGGK